MGDLEKQEGHQIKEEKAKRWEKEWGRMEGKGQERNGDKKKGENQLQGLDKGAAK